MAVANFEALCIEFCEIAGLARPDFEPNQFGTLSLSIQVQDVPITAIHYSTRPEHVYIFVTMGPLPQEQQLDSCRALLDANLLLLGSDTQVFGRDPDTGDCVLHCAYPMQAMTPTLMYDRVNALAGMAARWAGDHFLPDPRAEGAVQAQAETPKPSGQAAQDHAAPGGPATAFANLCREICRESQLPEPQLPLDDDMVALNMDMGGTTVSLLHFPLRSPGIIHGLVPLGSPPEEEPLPILLGFMAANVMLMAEQRHPAYSRNPASGELYYQFSQELAGTTARDLLAYFAGVVDNAKGAMEAIVDQAIVDAARAPEQPPFDMSSFA